MAQGQGGPEPSGSGTGAASGQLAYPSRTNTAMIAASGAVSRPHMARMNSSANTARKPARNTAFHQAAMNGVCASIDPAAWMSSNSAKAAMPRAISRCVAIAEIPRGPGPAGWRLTCGAGAVAA